MTKLKKYNEKRNFEKTLEPEGKEQITSKALRYCIQHHIARRDHYDLRLEWDGAMLSWAVPKGPSFDTSERRLSVHVEDHPLDYKTFEGTIPKGEYGGGTVMLWDEGYWKPSSDVDKGMENGVLKFKIKGRRLKGKWTLIRLEKKENEKQDNWLLIKEEDEYAKSDDGISEFTTSIKTGRTMDEITKGKNVDLKNPFDNTDVQLAKLVDNLPKSDNWLYELKFDGYRILAYIENNKVRLMTRNGKDYTKKFNSVVDSLVNLAEGRSMVLDGEMVIIDASGKSDFQALQNYIKNPKGKNLAYMVFDLIALDGVDLRKTPLIERKGTLDVIMQNKQHGLYYSCHVIGKGMESFNAACEQGMEGIVGKKIDSIYSGTRNGDWIKYKCENRQEFVIGGYTISDKQTSGLSSFLLGVYDGKDLIFAGRTGTGMSEKERKQYKTQFAEYLTEKPPFKNPPSPASREKFFWMEPKIVAEVKFAEWTKENLLRQASFKGLRTDKNPKDVKMEKPINHNENNYIDEEQKDLKTTNKKVKAKVNSANKTINNDLENLFSQIKITSPDKVIFKNPKITKGEIIEYYAKVSNFMLPYVSNRVLSIVRCPKGVRENCFYKKHPNSSSKEVVTIPITNDEGKTEDYFYIDNVLGLIAEAQMGTLEFHVWGSRVDSLEKPDIMVFDLDPDEGMDIVRLRQGVKDIKKILEDLALKSYLKTSGGKGYHVVVPFEPTASWEVFHDFSRRIAEVMEQKWPSKYTSNIRKINRKNKIFIDWVRNGKGATCISPYSIRARKGAKVSMPISWNELDNVAPNDIDMADALKRLEKPDPWKDFFKNNQKLK